MLNAKYALLTYHLLQKKWETETLVVFSGHSDTT